MNFDVSATDLLLIGFLALLECLLSIDNAIVLAMMVGHLPRQQQGRALTYGIAGSIVFRLAALYLATRLIHQSWTKYVGGAYLLYVAIDHFVHLGKVRSDRKRPSKGFWHTVVLIELMDIAFAIDSILAAVALTPKIWIVLCGGMIGVLFIRLAATGFLSLLRRFPRLERSAYALIFVIGIKLILDGLRLKGLDFDSLSSPASIVFWVLMVVLLLLGFRRKPLR